jgi:hypothetical protein
MVLEQPAGEFVTGTCELRWNASDAVDDDLNGTLMLYYSSDNGTSWDDIIAFDLNNTGSYLWNTYGFADSLAARVMLTATDDAGNTGNATTAPFKLDNMPPAVTITQPVGGEIFGPNATVEIEWEATDAVDGDLNGDISIEYHNGTAWSVLAQNIPNSGRYPFNPIDWDDGIYKIRVRAVDDAGNVGMATSANFTIDRQAPSLSFNRPLNGLIYINLFGRDLIPPLPIPFESISPYDLVNVIIVGTIDVEFSAYDVHSGVQRIEVVMDGSDPFPLYENPWEWTWNPSFGFHTLSVTAYDNAGNARSIVLDRILCLNI